MAFTQAQITALEAAIATGQTRVQYGDKYVQYDSISEMLKLLQQMKDEVAAVSTTPVRHTRAAFNRG